jgi:PAS domain S-box-containing protein
VPPRTQGVSDVVFERAPDAIIVTDADGIVTGWNAAAEQIYGITAQLALGRPRDGLLAVLTADGAEFGDFIDKAIRSSGRWRGRVVQCPQLGTRQGDDIIADTHISALSAPDGSFAGAISFNRDVTATARVEAELTTLVELTRLSVGADQSTIARDLLARIVSVLGAAAGSVVQVDGDRLLSIATVDSDGDFEQLQGDGTTAADWALDSRFDNGALAFVETIAGGSGSARMLGAAHAAGYRAYAALPIRDGERLVAVFLAVFRFPAGELPIDERTLESIGRVLDISFANQRLRDVALASEDRYRTLFERSPDALLVETFENAVVDANPAARRLFGNEVVGVRVSQLADINAKELEEQTEFAATRGTATWAGVGRRLDGTTFSEEVESTRVQIGGEDRILTRVRDTTERDLFQQELLQAQKMEAIGLLVAGVAHELNNPLASIVAFSQLIRTDPQLPEPLRHQAEMLIQEANRTRRIVQNLLDFARQRPPERVPTSIRELIDGVLALQSYTFGPSRIEVTVEIPDDLPDVSLDRAQIQQVLINLTLNAAQAIQKRGARGSITIRTERAIRPDGSVMVRMWVTDDGPGIPEHLRSRLFVPFFTTKSPGEGTGLGLSVSFGIVTGHGGNLRYEPGPGGVGSTFIVELPIEPNAAPGRVPMAAEPTPAADDRAPARDGRAGTGKTAVAAKPWRVLVLDDEPAIRDFLSRILRRGGYEPVLASDGRAALEIVKNEPPDAILCDHRMAGMSGIAFHVAVAEIDPQLARRFVFMSGDVLNPELSDFAVERGITLLAKPFDIESVDRTVARILGPVQGAG